jgi:hypothetical protein
MPRRSSAGLAGVGPGRGEAEGAVEAPSERQLRRAVARTHASRAIGTIQPKGNTIVATSIQSVQNVPALPQDSGIHLVLLR